MMDIHRLSGENEEQYIWRLGMAKDSGELDMSWEEIADIINKEFREDDSEYRGESAYRKQFACTKRFIDAGVFSDRTNEACLALMQEERRCLAMERQKLRDERSDFQKSLREEARKQSFLELVERVLQRNVEPLDYKPSPSIVGEDDMVVCLSDLHAGIKVENWWNRYDIDILRRRLCRYIDKIKEIQRVHRCKRCELVLGGDDVSGLIHTNLRLQNNENVIEQVKFATTFISDFVSELQDCFEEIRVHSVAGNHSRLSPNKEEHLKGEELDALIPFCLKLKFANNPTVIITEDGMIDNTINSFVTRGGKLFYLVHGDKDTPANVVKNLTLMTGKKPDVILMGHRHHNAFDTQYGVKIVQMGCVVGTDDHCVDIRITGEPEQCVLITNKDRAVKCLYDVGLA